MEGAGKQSGKFRYETLSNLQDPANPNLPEVLVCQTQTLKWNLRICEG